MKTNFILFFQTIILGLFLCSFADLKAQNKPNTSSKQSDIAAWYKITDEEAEQILKGKQEIEDSTLLHSLTGMASREEFYPKNIEHKGYYLKVSVNAENLDFELRSFNSISAQILNIQRGFALRVVDSMGILLQNADVTYNNKRLPFEAATQTYRCQKCKKRGLLVIKALEETVLYEVEKEDNYWRSKPFFQTKVGKIVKFPYTLAQRFWRKLKTFSFFEKKYHGKEYQGYIACNQPKYQPLDTVKVKAFITNRKGKPLTQILEARLQKGKYDRKAIWKQDVEPNRKGNYEVELVLGDSLQLDETYSIGLYNTKPNQYSSLMSQSFDYEDYELDAIEYSFKSDKEKYAAEDSIELHLSATYKTGLYVPDAFVKLTARTRVLDYTDKVDNFQADEVLVKDTIWTHSQVLNASDTTLIYFPLSALPNANAKIWVDAEFTDSSGELQGQSLSFEVTQKNVEAGCLQLRLEGAYVIAECIENGTSVPKKVSFDIMGMDSEIYGQRVVELPYSERVNGGVSTYWILSIDGDESTSLDMEKLQPNIEAGNYQQNDSIYIYLQNPRQIPVYYSIYEGKKLLQQGETEEERFVWQHIKGGKENYFIEYSYLWADEPNKQLRQFDFPKNRLDIRIEQPKNIQPSEKVTVKISVKDHQKKAASKVNLLAGAINGQFETFDNFSGPYLRQKKAKEPKGFPVLELNLLDSEKGKKNVERMWYKKLQLEQKTYYQLRYPDKGVFMQMDSIEEISPQDTFYRSIAQFAPHLVKDGKEQPIYLIFCNRQLVHYYEVNSNAPYSFVGQNGYNQIEIRGRDFSYTIDSVLLKNGHKLTFSIDENHYLQSEQARHIHRQAAKPELSKQELNLLKQQIFFLRTPYEKLGDYYVLQDAHTIHPIEAKRSGTWQIGPFFPRNNLTLIRKNHYHNTFLFEEGFEYEIEAQRERLYENKHFDKPFPLPYSLPQKPIGQVLFHPKNIVTQDTLLKISFDTKAYRTNRKNGLYKLEYITQKNLKDDLFAIVLMANDSTYGVYEPNTRQWNNLPPHDYQLLLVKNSGAYFQKSFKIEANALTFQRIDTTANFVVDSAYQFLNGLTQKRFQPISKKKIPEQKVKKYFGNIKSNGVSGVEGQITDKETGEPLIGVNVVVKGTTTGTVTDIDGFYRLDLIADDYTLEVSYIGYETTTMNTMVTTYGHQEFNLELEESKLSLDEVVIVGYSTFKRGRGDYMGIIGNLKREDQTVTSKMIVSMPTLNVSSIAGMAAGVYQGNDKYDVLTITGARDSATEYYIDGIKVRGLDSLPNSALSDSKVQLRSNFSDYAYWQPNLLTDQNGEAYFTVTFPDNSTQWRTFVLGMNDKEQGGFASTKTNAFKKIMGQLSVPRFLIEGDETAILGKSLNYTEDSIHIETQFKMNEEVLQSNSANIKEALIEKTNITAPSNRDSLIMTYLLTTQDGYGDGEKRQIPILKKGVEETTGDFYVLENDTPLQLSFNGNLGEVHLYAQNSIFDLLQKDLDYLQNYPFGCNEQNASRLMAFLLEKEIKAQLEEPFRHEQEIRKTIKKLEKAQNNNGSWGWWQNGKTNPWMSLYVTKALQKAKDMGYIIPAINTALKHITNSLPQNLSASISTSRNLNPPLLMKMKMNSNRQLLNTLAFLSEIGQNADYEKYLKSIESNLSEPTLYDQLQILKIRQIWDLPHDLQLLDSLRQESTFGNFYWGKNGYGWYDNAIQNTLLAFNIYQRANRTEDCQKIIGYLLERRGRNCWRNTFETAQILQAILPTLLKESGGKLEENQLVLSGAFDQTITEFPFEAKVLINKSLTVHKTGSTPLYFTTNQSFWNPKPKAKSDVFAVQTSWQNAQSESLQSLKAAEKATLKVDIEVKESAEYVMIEVPIPAGCSYGNKGKNSNPYEVHREYFKEKVAIFCENLPVGKHSFEVPLEARYTGDYTVNPAKVEQMYFPVFYGRNELQRIEID
ncbi:MAG: carboxypeptidase-like regulatory domain-containing protein [Chitinophagales bacterium]